LTRETSDCEARKPLAFDCNLRIARVLFGISIENKSLSAVSLSLVSSEPLEFEFALVFFDAAAAAVSALVFLVAAVRPGFSRQVPKMRRPALGYDMVGHVDKHRSDSVFGVDMKHKEDRG